MDLKPSVSCKIDWLSASKKGSLKDYGVTGITLESSRIIAESCYFELGYTGFEMVAMRPLPHYVFAWGNSEDSAVVHVSANIEQQGVLYRAGGTSLQNGHTSQIRLSRAVESNWRITRLDVAYDFVNFAQSVYGFALAHRKYNEGHKKATTGLIESKGGCTYTVGSRSSLIFARLYDKGGEQNTVLDWKRLEFEIKDDKAVQFAALGRIQIMLVTGELLRWIGEFDHEYIDALKMMAWGDVTDRITTPKPQTDRAKWFLSTVLTSYRKWALEDPVGAQMWLDSVSLEFQSAMEELETRGLTPII